MEATSYLLIYASASGGVIGLLAALPVSGSAAVAVARTVGSGLISSPGECTHSLESPEVDRRPFDLDRVCDTAFEIDHYQPILYVLESFDQLRNAMTTYAKRIMDKTAAAARV